MRYHLCGNREEVDITVEKLGCSLLEKKWKDIIIKYSAWFTSNKKHELT